jgi:ATP-binding cassette subfamily F protein 2
MFLLAAAPCQLTGCGKSTMLKAIAERDIPIPEHFDMYLLEKEIPAR